MQNPSPTLSQGDPLKSVALPSTAGAAVGAAEWFGRYTVLLFYMSEQLPVGVARLEAMRDAYEQFADRNVGVYGISVSSPADQKAFNDHRPLPFPLLSDNEFRLSTLLGALRPPEQNLENAMHTQMVAFQRTVILSPNGRIHRIYENSDPTSHPSELLSEIDAQLERDPARRMHQHAPVLIVPDVLPPEECNKLIDIWHTHGNADSGFMQQVGGKTVGVYDYQHKIRRDHFMQAGPDLTRIKQYISSRVLSAIATAFNYEVTRFEDIRIACYDAERGGFFRPHRDNTTDATAHRRFAMSLLLNNDYEGGALRFPEYGLHEYRPSAGSAVVFSCSLLHEAMDIQAGKRFVMLTFFYGEKEAKIREEYNRRTGGAYRSVSQSGT